jgi:hydroxymethylpyrimidine pyrophosphatase-like HAD family hydrolase
MPLTTLKQIADDVTPLDNDHDGLAKYLQDYFHLDAAKLQLAE